jgi:cell division septation protein DedD
MNIKPEALKLMTLAASVLAGVFFLNLPPASAQTSSTPNTTATRPATTPTGQTSIPNSSPPATTTQTTGEVSRDPAIKKMNEDAKRKVETEGK